MAHGNSKYKPAAVDWRLQELYKDVGVIDKILEATENEEMFDGLKNLRELLMSAIVELEDIDLRIDWEDLR